MAANGSPASYGDEWNRLLDIIIGCDGDLNKLKSNGSFHCNKFRSIYWRIFLKSLSAQNVGNWDENISANRSAYRDLLNKYQLDPRVCAGKGDPNWAQLNPLSLEADSPWQQWFNDRELKLCIEQDVERTFPELEYFHSTDVRDIMIEILFLYARLHPKVGYKQGMHEILAPILFVLFFDQQSFAHATEIGEVSAEKVRMPVTLKSLTDPSYLAADAYYFSDLFARLMSVIQSWYSYSEISSPIMSSTKQAGLTLTVPFARPQDSGPSSALVRKLNFISDKLVKEIDPQLHKHLEDLEIAPQIYGIRWLRLLFGREFPIHDLLVVWDAIFLDGDPFMLVDFIYVAMLEVMRDILLASDYTDCLYYLMKFPAISDVQTILKLAYHYQDPGRYPKPTGAANLLLNQMTQVAQRLNVKTISETGSSKSVPSAGKKVESVRKSPSFSRLFIPRRPSTKESAKLLSGYPEVGNVDASLKKHPPKNWAPNGKGMVNSATVPHDVLELLKEQIGQLQTRLDDVEATSFKVADRINKHTEFLTQRFSDLGLTTDDPAYQSIVELKQLCHSLRGLLPTPFEHSPIVAMINTPVEIGTDATSQSEFTEVPHTDEKSTVYRQSLNFGGVDEQMNFVAVSQENEMKELHHANHHN